MSKYNFQKKLSANKSNATSLNVEKLRGILSYFSHLRSHGEISDKAFEALVRYACTIFIENEVEVLIQDALERKLMKFFTEKFDAETEEIEELSAVIDSWNLPYIRSR